MKKQDVLAALGVVAVVVFFSVWRSAYDAVYAFSPALVAFAKFALLATFGETIVNRVVTGRYVGPGFGLLPKALVWGALGLLVYSAFVIFEAGVTVLLFSGAVPADPGGQLARAFLISLFMNLIFAPVLMTVHRLSDLFIELNGGRFPIARLRPAELLATVDWRRMWQFVFLRTIPLFWVPAHTVTFLLPPDLRLLYAAGLSVALGLFMSVLRGPRRGIAGAGAAAAAPLETEVTP